MGFELNRTGTIVSKLSTRAVSCLGLTLLFGGIYLSTSTTPFSLAALVLTAVFGWLGLIQLLNRFALYFPRPCGALIHWVHAMTFEGLAILTAASLRPLRYLPSHRVSIGKAKGRPILLVHGYLHDSSGWVYQKCKLSRAGFGPIYVLNLGRPFRSIREHAEKVREKAEQIEEETERRDLILIGHSMGGLVSAWYATKLAPPGKVTDLVTIGSPMAGTHVARIGIGSNAREMERDSELLKELQREIQNQRITRFYHIATKTDQLVIPSSSALLGGDYPERQFIVQDIGHLTLLFSPRVTEQICSWLKEPVEKLGYPLKPPF